jgi:hypothetical protein
MEGQPQNFDQQSKISSSISKDATSRELNTWYYGLVTRPVIKAGGDVRQYSSSAVQGSACSAAHLQIWP